MSHTISTFYAAFFVGIILLLNIKKFKERQIRSKIFINLLFTILCTLCVLGPIIEHKISTDYLIFNTRFMGTSPESVSQTGVNLKLLLKKDYYDGWGFDYRFGIFNFFFIMLIFIYLKKIIRKKINISFLVCSIICFYLATNIFPYKVVLPIFANIQYLWRLFGFFIIFMAPIMAEAFYYFLSLFRNKKVKSLVFSIIMVLQVLFTYIFVVCDFSTINYNGRITDEMLESVLVEEEKIGDIVNPDDYPLKFNNSHKDVEKIYTLNGEAKIKEEKKINLNMQVQIETAKAGTILEFPYIYYLGYNIKLVDNQQEKRLKYFESDNGYIAVEINENIEDAKIEIKYKGTYFEKVCYIISIISITLFAIYILQENKGK